jgi:hypothetical protein
MRGQVRQREFAVHRRRQHAAPGVEHLQRLRAGRCALRARYAITASVLIDSRRCSAPGRSSASA